MNFSKARFGEFFNALRTESGLSMADVAKKTGLATTTVFSIEQGEGRVSVDQLFRVAKVFGYQPDILLEKYCRRMRALKGHATKRRSENTNGHKADAMVTA